MKISLISDWKKSWKFASIQIPATGLIIMSSLDYASQVWYQLGDSVHSRLPYSTAIGISFLVLSIIGRLVKFTSKDDADGNGN